MDTRPLTNPTRVPAGQPPDSAPSCAHQLRNPGATLEELTTAEEDRLELLRLLQDTDALDPRIWGRLLTEEAPELSRTVLIALMILNSGMAWAVATATAVDQADTGECTIDVVQKIIDTAVRLTNDDDYAEAIERVARDATSDFGERLRSVVYERMQMLRDQPLPHTIRFIVDSAEGPEDTFAAEAPS